MELLVNLLLRVGVAALVGVVLAPAAPAAPLSGAQEDTCRTLAEVALRAGSADLSKADARRLQDIRKEALSRNLLRPAIDAERVVHAEVEGRKSHGSHGLGNRQLAAARDDGFEAALDVFLECLTDAGGP